MAKLSRIERPLKKSEYALIFGTRQAERGWRDLRATQAASLADAWDQLTRDPLARSEKNHPLKGDLATIVRDGVQHERWQHELSGGARLWFYVVDHTVVIIDCHTRHPNETR